MLAGIGCFDIFVYPFLASCIVYIGYMLFIRSNNAHLWPVSLFTDLFCVPVITRCPCSFPSRIYCRQFICIVLSYFLFTSFSLF